jgi:hypothetical protein
MSDLTWVNIKRILRSIIAALYDKVDTAKQAKLSERRQ